MMMMAWPPGRLAERKNQTLPITHSTITITLIAARLILRTHRPSDKQCSGREFKAGFSTVLSVGVSIAKLHCFAREDQAFSTLGFTQTTHTMPTPQERTPSES